MDWLTFFATDIKALAWPTVAIIALFMLRHEIGRSVRALGNRIRSFKGFGVETTFGEAIDEIEEILPASEIKEIAAPPAIQRLETISELSQLPPPYIVSQAWLGLEQAIREALDYRLPTDERRPLSPSTYLTLARQQGLLTQDEEPAVQRLRQMRNLAAHDPAAPITMTDALRYHDIADVLIEKIAERRARANR